MKKIIWRIGTLIVAAAILTSIYHVSYSGDTRSYVVYPASSDAPTATIHELNDKRVPLSTYTVEGYTVKLYDCPPCPRGAMCKPCMGNNIVLSENKLPIETYDNLSSTDLIVFVDRAKQFDVGAKYRMTVKVSEHSTTGIGSSLNDVELVGFTKLE